MSFKKADFLPEGQSNTLADTGYLFAPKKCLEGLQCAIHIAFHGCLQNEEKIGMDFIESSGYNEWAEANNIVIVYPQTTASYFPINPKGCWGWWGYTGAEYQYRGGAQLSHINNIVKTI
ncbi:MAG: poly(3-hydroxybutyrate) depolymerase [Lentisphaeria bacterium]